MDRNILIIFVKAPVPGKVKTRLVPYFTYEEAAAQYMKWAQHLYQQVSCLKDISVQVAYAPSPDFLNPFWLNLNNSISFFYQVGYDLGEKLVHAFQKGFFLKAKHVVVIGTDSPDLPMEYISEAFFYLEKNEVVVGPAEDGGYYLIGLKEKVYSGLFENINWSTEKVLNQTLNAAERFNLQTHLLPVHYDIDSPEDLKKIKGVFHANT